MSSDIHNQDGQEKKAGLAAVGSAKQGCPDTHSDGGLRRLTEREENPTGTILGQPGDGSENLPRHINISTSSLWRKARITC